MKNPKRAEQQTPTSCKLSKREQRVPKMRELAMVLRELNKLAPDFLDAMRELYELAPDFLDAMRELYELAPDFLDAMRELFISLMGG